MPKLKPDTLRGGTSRSSHLWDTATETGTCVDDFEDWKSSIDASEMADHNEAAKGVTDEGPQGEHSAAICSAAGAWQHSGDLMRMKDGCGARATLCEGSLRALAIASPCIDARTV